MNTLDIKMIELLEDLKENHLVTGVKAEFEAEGSRIEEVKKLKEFSTITGLDLTIKIGGCEAVRDMYDARSIGANIIVAPMIETPYAVKKFINAVKTVFAGSLYNNIKFFINIETITGYNNINEIINMPEFNYISGVVLGRFDLASSIGLEREDINSNKIFNIAELISKKIKTTGKEMVIGGGVCPQSISFFSKLPYITKFETRKIIFNSSALSNNQNTENGILKAIDFELLWLKNKREFYGVIFNEDKTRIKMLEKIYNHKK